MTNAAPRSKDAIAVGAGAIAIAVIAAGAVWVTSPKSEPTPAATAAPKTTTTVVASAPQPSAQAPTPTAETPPPAQSTTVYMDWGAGPLASAPRNGRSVFAEAIALVTNGDTQGARALLEPRVFGGRATPDEVNLLRGVCKSQHDNVCTSAIRSKYDQ